MVVNDMSVVWELAGVTERSGSSLCIIYLLPEQFLFEDEINKYTHFIFCEY